jgi:cytochrome c oxidase assembly protein subunit 15
MAGALPPNLQLRQDRQLRHSLALLASHLVVALVALVAIGGATRVMEAGLACPDWPLCYGSFLPGQQMNVQVFLEWFHRLDAFVVGMALLVFVGVGVALRRRLPTWLPWMAALALGLVAFQGALGALTVTHLLASPLVTAHLATALVLVSLVSGIYQRLAMVPEVMVPEVMGPQVMGPQVSNQSPAVPRWWQALAVLALVLVFSQCLLGGLMASQWAADQCLASGEACQWLLAHRQLALGAAGGVALMAATAPLLPRGLGHLQGLAFGAIGLVALQVGLGIWTLRLQLAVPAVTVAHQLVAALLVALLSAVLARALAPLQPHPSQELAHG